MSDRKVVLRAYWTEMVALNFQIDPGKLETYVPPGLELDFHHEAAYISLIFANCRDVRIFGLPLPITRGYKTIYLRFYVKRTTKNGVEHGSCMVKSLVSSRLARWSIQRTIHTPTSVVKIKSQNSGFDAREGTNIVPMADYSWFEGDEANRLKIKARHRIPNLSPDTKVGFILNRNFHYVRDNNQTYAFPMEVTSTNVWDAAQASFSCDSKNIFGPDFAYALSRRPISVFLAEKNTNYFFAPALI
ncbi:MAG: DUF2071 domain-containing protein [Pirellulaceae bacterium]